MGNTREIFRENLRKILQDRGKSLTGAAEDCGISLSYMNQLVSGKKSFSDETIDKLAKGLGVKRYELFITEEESQAVNAGHSEIEADPIRDLLSVIQNLDPEDIKTLIFTAKGLSQIDENSLPKRDNKTYK